MTGGEDRTANAIPGHDQTKNGHNTTAAGTNFKRTIEETRVLYNMVEEQVRLKDKFLRKVHLKPISFKKLFLT